MAIQKYWPIFFLVFNLRGKYKNFLPQILLSDGGLKSFFLNPKARLTSAIKAGTSTNLKNTVQCNQTSSIFPVSISKLIPDNNHCDTSGEADQYQSGHSSLFLFAAC